MTRLRNNRLTHPSPEPCLTDQVPSLYRSVLLHLILACTSCAKPALPQPDAGLPQPEVDAGPMVTEVRLGAWLRWQQALQALPQQDAGDRSTLRQRARQEAALLSENGLTSEQAEAIEAVVSAVVAERNVARLTGADALGEFRARIQQLSPEQRLKAEAALVELQAKSAHGSLASVVEVYGPEAVRVVLTREAEVVQTWDALFEGEAGRFK